MPFELVYTSAERGLKRNSSGYCTVAQTAGLSAAMVRALESLSVVTKVFPSIGDARWASNPPVFSHWSVQVEGARYAILSRVKPTIDVNGREALFAHHVALAADERPGAGPAALLRQRGLLLEAFEGEPRELAAGRAIPSPRSPARICAAWAAAAGDAGWAGRLADRAILDAEAPAYIVYRLGVDVLALAEEALALLPAAMRWKITFTTLTGTIPAGSTCVWRFCEETTPATRKAREAGNFVIDLTSALGPASDGKSVRLARTGVSEELDLEATQAGPPPVGRPVAHAHAGTGTGTGTVAASGRGTAHGLDDGASEAVEDRPLASLAAAGRPRVIAARARGNPALIALAVGSLLLNGVLAFALLRHEGDSPATPPTRLAERAEDPEVAQLRLDNFAKDTKLAQATDSRRELQRQVEGLERDLAAAKRDLSAARATVASPPIETLAPPPTASRPSAIAASTPPPKAAVAAPPDASPAVAAPDVSPWQYATLPEASFNIDNPAPVTQRLVAAIGATRVEMVSPLEKLPKRIKILATDRGVLVEHVGDFQGSPRETWLARAELADGDLVWTWEPFDRRILEADESAALHRLASHCVLRLRARGALLTTVQFLRENALRVSRDQDTVPAKLEWTGCHPELSITGTAALVRLDNPVNPLRAQVAPAAERTAVFEIALAETAGGVEVRSTYREARKATANEVDALQRDAKGLDDRIQKQKSTIDASKKEIDKETDPTKKAELAATRETARKELDRLQAIPGNLASAKARLKALTDLADFDVEVVARYSRAKIAAIRITR